MSNELKACPWCGEVKDIYFDNITSELEGREITLFRVYCPRCLNRTEILDAKDEADAIKLWNTRTADKRGTVPLSNLATEHYVGEMNGLRKQIAELNERAKNLSWKLECADKEIEELRADIKELREITTKDNSAYKTALYWGGKDNLISKLKSALAEKDKKNEKLLKICEAKDKELDKWVEGLI